MAIVVFVLFVFFKRKFTSDTNTTTWKDYLMTFIIILLIFSFIYLCFFESRSEAASKYTGQLITKIDETIDKYDKTINSFKGLKSDWENELKELYKSQEIHKNKKLKLKNT
ncbi:hypothetical protein HPP_0640 [Hydrangea phyllody phytoplasma]|uniref:Uncharacterized protein n=2 Tax=16SrI (Aster yellows group) TaxID=3042590 RepID=A0ABQ5PSA3_9MOLU|nr:hypothetical protein [Hydrangea phyllody phytoplasma]GFZ75106.1 hypothetical protein HPP_0640 [Hydrangea phyllody phytoplasma]GLH61224.1 hypothetical protein RHYP_1690 [Rhus yellows phytoplasma]GLH61888.1 hypothetical protein HP2P_2950 [Hydrangea phyllody phytoplasma]